MLQTIARLIIPSVAPRRSRKTQLPRPPEQAVRSEFAGDELEAYDSVLARFGANGGDNENPVHPYFGALLNSPRMAAALSTMGTLIRSAPNRGGTYTHADRELVDQVISFDWGYYGVLPLHLPDAVAVGVRLEAIEAIRDGDEKRLTPDERQLVDYVRRVLSGTVTDTSYDALERRLGCRGAAEYTIFVAYLGAVIRLFQAFGIASPPKEAVDEIIEGIRAGRIPVPSYDEAALRR